MFTIKDCLKTIEHIARVRAVDSISPDTDANLKALQDALGRHLKDIADNLPAHLHAMTDGAVRLASQRRAVPRSV